MKEDKERLGVLAGEDAKRRNGNREGGDDKWVVMDGGCGE